MYVCMYVCHSARARSEHDDGDGGFCLTESFCFDSKLKESPKNKRKRRKKEREEGRKEKLIRFYRRFSSRLGYTYIHMYMISCYKQKKLRVFPPSLLTIFPSCVFLFCSLSERLASPSCFFSCLSLFPWDLLINARYG